MIHFILILFSFSFTACLGPVVGEKAQPYLQEEIQWNVQEGEVVAGQLDLRVEVMDHTLFQGEDLLTELTLNQKPVVDTEEDPFVFRHAVQTFEAGKEWPEGPIEMTFTVKTPDFEKTYVRTVILNNVTFNQRGSMLHPSFLPATTDHHGWLRGHVDRITDINGDGLDDWLILDGHLPYVRLSNTDLSENFQTAWEISSDSWDSITACDVNRDGHMDFVAGDPDDENGAGRIRIFYGPMSGSKSFASSQTFIGDSSHKVGTNVYMGQQFPYDYTIYDGLGDQLLCMNNGSILFSTRPRRVNHLNNSTFYNTIDDTTFMYRLQSGIKTTTTIELFPRTRFPIQTLDFNQDGMDDITLNNQIDDTQTTVSHVGAFPNVVITNIYSRPKLYLGKSTDFQKEIKLPEARWSGSSEFVVPTQSFVLGDLNGDGYDDFATTVIAWGLTPEGFAGATEISGLKPKTTVYFGAKTYPGHKLTFYHPTNTSPTTRFGEYVVSGDFNGDGYPDLAISAPGYSTSQHPTPEVFVYYGPSFTRYDRYETQHGSNTSWFGHRMLAMDFNHDGRDDLLASLWGGYTVGLTTYGNFEILYDNE